MKNIRNKSIVLLFIAFIFSATGTAQNSISTELKYEVNRIYPYISITKEKMNEANTLIDLNPDYKSSWIKTYISVEILTSHNGTERKAMSKNEILTQEQKDNLNMADVDKDISVKVRYIPDNTLKHNDIKELDFTFSVNPKIEAQFPGGQEQLNQYLWENAIDKIPDGVFIDYNLAAIKFSINEKGEISNVHVFESSKDEKIDGLLLAAIRNMPSWKPAEHYNGIQAKQEFVLTVGNMENCVINLLNIRRG